MNAKLSHFSELSDFLSEKSTVCNDFLSLLDKFKLGQSLRKLKMEKEKGASALDLLRRASLPRTSLILDSQRHTPSDEEGEREEETGRSKSKSRISDSVLDGDSENNEYAEGRDLRSDKHARREGGDANMQHSDHQGRRHLLHVELQTNAV